MLFYARAWPLRIVTEISRIPHRTRPLGFYSLLRVYRDLTKTGEPRYIVTLDETPERGTKKERLEKPKPKSSSPSYTSRTSSSFLSFFLLPSLFPTFNLPSRARTFSLG